MVSLTPLRLSSAAKVKNPRAQRRDHPLAHQESPGFPTQKFALWTSGLKDNAGRSEPLLRGSAWRTARRRGVHARPLGSRVPPQGSGVPRGTRPFARRRRGPYLSARNPRRLPASASAARTHTRPQRPGFPPLFSGPRRRAHAQRGPTEGVEPLAAEPEAATRPRLRPPLPDAAAGRSLPATTATPLRKRACVTGCSAPEFP